MTDLINRRRIAVDWDGTCIVDHTWPEMGDWLPGAKEALYRLAHIYDEVVIHTLRVAPVALDERTYRDPLDQIDAIAVMLEEARMPWNVYVWTKPYKPPAEFYVDDRAIRFEGDWDAVLAKIAVARATNQRENQMNDPITAGEGATLCAPFVFVDRDPGDEQPFEHDSPYPSDMFDEKGDYVPAAMRTFDTGATRNAEVDPDYHGFLSPLAVHAYGEYMHAHRLQADGSLRDSNNWQRGMPIDSYVRSLVRHTHDVQLIHDGYGELARADNRDTDKLKAHLAAVIFNAQGMLHELVKAELLEEAA